MVRTTNASPGAVVADLLDPASLNAACRDVDCIFHCAGYAHAFNIADMDAHRRINLEGTRNLLQAAANTGVKRFIFFSSVKAMAEPGTACVDEDWPGDPVTPYGRAKRAAEDAVLEAGVKFGMHVVNLRLAMVYGRGGRGNLERMARAIRAGWFPALPETGNQRSLVHVDDVVTAARLVAEMSAASGRTYILADARSYSGREIYDTIRFVLDMEPPRWRVPAWMMRGGGMIGDWAGRIAGREFPLNPEVIGRLLDSACYSPRRIERELGWRVKTDLVHGLREMLV